jgi:hypothetical protein
MNLKKSEPVAADGTEAGAERGELTGKALLIGGGVVALVGAGALAFVLLGGGEEPVASALPIPSASAAPTASETASPSTSASIPTYAAKNARDPFKALVRQGSGAAGGSTSAGTSPTTVPTSGSSVPAWTPPATTVTITATPSTSATSSSSSTTSPTAQPTVPYDVTLIVLSKIIDETHVEIVVDDFAVSAEVGYTFGPFKLKSVDTVAQTATVQYGEVVLDLALHQIVLLQNA